MRIFTLIIRYLLGLFIAYAGVKHFINPEFYFPFSPDFLIGKLNWVYVSGVAEIILGVSLFLPNHIAKYGALGIFFLMLAFLPIHVRDVIVENPAIGSTKLAWIRLPFQFLFMAWAYFIYKKLK